MEEKPDFGKMNLSELQEWAWSLAYGGFNLPIMTEGEKLKWLAEIVHELAWKMQFLEERIVELEKR